MLSVRLGLFMVAVFCSPVFAQSWMPKRIVAMEYPPLAAQARIEGTIKLEFLIEEDGSVRGTKGLANEEVPGPPLLMEAAARNALKWRFVRSPEANRSPFVVTYLFKLEGASRGKLSQEFVFEYPNQVVLTSEVGCPDHLPCNEAEAKEFQKTLKKSRRPNPLP